MISVHELTKSFGSKQVLNCRSMHFRHELVPLLHSPQCSSLCPGTDVLFQKVNFGLQHVA